MITNDDTALAVLNQLIQVGRDAEQGYQAAADRVEAAELVELFEGYALQRGKFVRDLQARVRTLRGSPADAGTPAGAAHRGWMGLKAEVNESEIHAVLEECVRGDALSTKTYAAALGETELDPQTRQLIQEQYEQVQAAHDRVRQLRDSSTYAAR